MVEKKKVYDVVIVGGGPAAISSAIYLARRNLCVLMVYGVLGGQASTTADIENYVGFKFITGEEFTKRLNEHLKEYDISCQKEIVKIVKAKGSLFSVEGEENNYIGKAVIISSGARQRKLGVPGEAEFLNKGVAYCATCDAPLFRNKEVAIIGGGNSALEAAIQLESYSKKIYLVIRGKELKGEAVLINKVKGFDNVEVVPSASIKEIKGSKFVEKIIVEQEGSSKELDVQGVFVEIGYIPNSEIIEIKKNERNEIMISNKNETSIKGVFAAGDVTEIPTKQIIVSAGEGAKAAISAADYLARLK
ncbi:FAD-dependent oxidoreductase [archaeon]|jgi:NADH-dependent peroxiredoxin subunit F|nr:FAD-dependent oxidoreductase [archaeon]